MDRLTELYAMYGQKMVELEIMQGQIAQIKKELAEELNKKNQAPSTPTPVPSANESSN